MKVALLIIDMQAGLFQEETPRYDAEKVVERINSVARSIRAAGGSIIFVQHDGQPGDCLEPGKKSWEILPALERTNSEMVIRKQACDAFYETGLADLLQKLGSEKLIITGCATDFCIDTTVRAAASRDYEVIVVADGHTTADRPHLKAEAIIWHHNWMWENLILPHSKVVVRPAEQIAKMVQPELQF